MQLVKIKDAQGEIKILNIEAISSVEFLSDGSIVFIYTNKPNGISMTKEQWDHLVEKVFNNRLAPEIRDLTNL